MDHHHMHHDCHGDHELKLCKNCNVVYCKNCHEEWKKYWTYCYPSYPYAYTSISGGVAGINTIDPNTTATVACSHN